MLKLIPAIDLISGKCVRLQQGNFSEKTTYPIDPLQCAEKYYQQGAQELHIVDLDGAKQGSPQQLKLIKKIHDHLSETSNQQNREPLKIQIGGGFRKESFIIDALDNGFDRIVIGSMVVTQSQKIKKLIENFGVERFVLALDVKIVQEPMLTIQGWQAISSKSLWDVLDEFSSHQNLRILCTDVAVDGLGCGTNLDLYKKCQAHFPQFHFQASGGVGSVEDLIELQKNKIPSVIVGKALYDHKFTLSAAFQALKKHQGKILC